MVTHHLETSQWLRIFAATAGGLRHETKDSFWHRSDWQGLPERDHSKAGGNEMDGTMGMVGMMMWCKETGFFFFFFFVTSRWFKPLNKNSLWHWARSETLGHEVFMEIYVFFVASLESPLDLEQNRCWATKSWSIFRVPNFVGLGCLRRPTNRTIPPKNAPLRGSGSGERQSSAPGGSFSSAPVSSSRWR